MTSTWDRPDFWLVFVSFAVLTACANDWEQQNKRVREEKIRSNFSPEPEDTRASRKHHQQFLGDNSGNGVEWAARSNRIKPEKTASCPCEDRFLERIQDLERKVNDMFLESDKLTTKMIETIDAVEQLLSTGSTSSEHQLAKQRQIVSFMVQAARNMPYLSESEVIRFDKVLVNNGGAYDPHSGTFVAPVSGVYLFSASILSGYNSTIETMITLNGHDVSRLYSGAFNNRGFGSSTAILNLQKGDEVAVAVFYGNGNYVHGKWSTFCGTLIETY